MPYYGNLSCAWTLYRKYKKLTYLLFIFHLFHSTPAYLWVRNTLDIFVWAVFRQLDLVVTYKKSNGDKQDSSTDVRCTQEVIYTQKTSWYLYNLKEYNGIHNLLYPLDEYHIAPAQIITPRNWSNRWYSPCSKRCAESLGLPCFQYLVAYTPMTVISTYRALRLIPTLF